MKMYSKFEPGEVDYVDYANERLILKVGYQLGKKHFEEVIFIYEGVVSFFHAGSIIADLYFCRLVPKHDAKVCYNWIKGEANCWCRNLGLPEITKLLVDKRLT